MKKKTELWQEPPDPLLMQVKALLTDTSAWSGTATQLAEVLQLQITPIALAMRLNVRAGKLMNDYNIRYESARTHASRVITLTQV